MRARQKVRQERYVLCELSFRECFSRRAGLRVCRARMLQREAEEGKARERERERERER